MHKKLMALASGEDAPAISPREACYLTQAVGLHIHLACAIRENENGAAGEKAPAPEPPAPSGRKPKTSRTPK